MPDWKTIAHRAPRAEMLIALAVAVAAVIISWLP